VSTMNMPNPFANCPVDHHALVNNSSYFPDVFFSDDKKQLCCHSWVLKVRAPHMLDDGIALKKKKQKAGGPMSLDLVKKQCISFEAFERLILYVYTGTVDMASLNPSTAIDLIHVSSTFKVTRVLNLASKYLQDCLNHDNIFKTLKYSDSVPTADARNLCVDWVLQKPDMFVTSNLAEEIGFKLYQEVTSLILKNQSTLTRTGLMQIDTTVEDTILADWRTIYSNGISNSGDIAMSFKTGEKLTFNKAVLAEQSPDLQGFTQQLASSVNHKNPQPVSLPEKYQGISGKSFASLLQYCYCNDTGCFDQVSACELLYFANELKANKLIQILMSTIQNTSVTAASCILVLSIGYNTQQEQLKQNAMNFIVSNFSQVDLKPLQVLPPVVGYELLLALQKKGL